MHLSRREFVDNFLGFVGEVGDDDARTLAEQVYNRVLTKIWLAHPWSEFRSPVPFQLTLTVDQARYALPDYFGRIGPGLVRNVTRGLPINPLPRVGEIEEDFPSAGTTFEVSAIPEFYEITGSCDVHTQPASTGEALEVLSDSASDTDIVVGIAGDDSTGRWTRNQVTLTGTTPVNIGTWAFVDEFGKAYPAGTDPATALTSSRGTVTLRKQSGGTELQKLFTQESAKQHAIIRFYPKPSAADTVAIPVIRKPKRSFRDADVIPDLWEPMVHEEMLLQWKVNTGEIDPLSVSNALRPEFINMVAHDNAVKPRPHTRPYRR